MLSSEFAGVIRVNRIQEGEGQLHAVSALNRTLVADHEASSQREKALQKQLMDERNSATAEMVQLSGSMKKEKAASSEELQSKTEEITALEQRLKVRRILAHFLHARIS